MKLPTVVITVNDFNPNWLLDESLPYPDRMAAYYMKREVEAEVLTVHFAKGNMRVRYLRLNGKVDTIDVPADPFFQKYGINEK